VATAAATTTTGLSAAQKTYYVNEFLARYSAICVAQRFGQSVPIDANNSTTANWFRYHPASLVTAAATVEGDTAALTYSAFTGMSITSTVATWNGQFEFSTLQYKTSRDPLLKGGTEVMADQAAESIDWNTLYIIAESGITCLPANAVSASTGAVVTTLIAEDVTLGTATTTALTVSASLGFGLSISASYLVGGWVTFTRGAGYGHASRISAQTSAADPIITIQDAAPQTPSTATQTTSPIGPPTHLWIASPFNTADPVASGDVINTGVLRKTEEILFKNKARKFSDGYYAAVIRPEVYTTLLADSVWQTAMQYQDKGALENNEIGKWSQIKFFRSTTPANYITTSGTMNSFSLAPSGNNVPGTGRIHVTYVFGQDAFGTVKLANSGFPEMNIEIGPTKSDPNDLYGRMGWKVYWAVKALNANFCVGIFSYA
jgi:hypothetical protein